MTIEIFGAVCFFFAIIHTFLVKRMQNLALRFPDGSVLENLFHLLGEVEVVFGLWAGVFLCWLAFTADNNAAASYLEKQNFTEPAFVFVIMVMSSTKPILRLASQSIEWLAERIPLPGGLPFFLVTLIVGPLLGSVITEPAAMTITALLLLDRIYMQPISEKLKYATLGLLFVNISIGGTLTPYAAPPILMVAAKWQWDLMFMLTHFGWKAVLAILTSTAIVAFKFRSELMNVSNSVGKECNGIPFWISALHLIFLGLIVYNSHHMNVFILIFLFFVGLTVVTKEYQAELKIKEGLLVAFFLGGLVILGGLQSWWLEPIVKSMNSLGLYFGSIGLTAVTDNAALTYLGSQVSNLSAFSKYALVAGSVVGGGLTVIANAPNPAGFGILNSSFGQEGVSPWLLFRAALLPTIVSSVFFWPV